MASYNLKATLTLIDKLSGPMGKAASAVTALNRAVQAATKSLEAYNKVQKRVASTQTGINKSTTNFGAAVDKKADKMREATKNMRAYSTAAKNLDKNLANLNDTQRQMFRNAAGGGGGRGGYRRTRSLPAYVGGKMVGAVGNAAGAVKDYGMYKAVGFAEQGVRSTLGGMLDTIKKGMEYEFTQKSFEAMISEKDRKMPDGTRYLDEVSKQAMETSRFTMMNGQENLMIAKELYRTNIKTKDILGDTGAMRQTSYLATGAEVSAEDAVQIMASSLNAFKKQNVTAKDVADSLTVHADVSAADVSDLYFAQRRFGSVASMYNMKMDDQNALFGMLANNGIKGQMAGTQLKYMIDYMTAPRNNNAAAAMKKYGWMDKNGKSIFTGKDGNSIRSNEEIFAVLTKTYETMQKQGRGIELATDFKTIFGQYSKNAAFIFGQEGTEGYKEYRARTDGLTAKSINDAKVNSAAGALKLFQNAIFEFQIAAINKFMPGLTKFFNYLTETVLEEIPDIEKWGKDTFGGAAKWVEEFKKSVDFGPNDSLMDKFLKIFTELANRFAAWIQSDAAAPLRDAIGKVFETAIKGAIEIGLAVAKEAAAGMWKSGKEIVKENPLESIVAGGLAALFGGAWLKKKLKDFGIIKGGKGGGGKNPYKDINKGPKPKPKVEPKPNTLVDKLSNAKNKLTNKTGNAANSFKNLLTPKNLIKLGKDAFKVSPFALAVTGTAPRMYDQTKRSINANKERNGGNLAFGDNFFGRLVNVFKKEENSSIGNSVGFGALKITNPNLLPAGLPEFKPKVQMYEVPKAFNSEVDQKVEQHFNVNPQINITRDVPDGEIISIVGSSIRSALNSLGNNNNGSKTTKSETKKEDKSGFLGWFK